MSSSGSDISESAEQQPEAGEKLNKKEQRQFEAKRREALKPLLNRVRKAEEAMARLRMDIELIEKRLHDDTLYSDPDRREELTSLVKRQAEARQELQGQEEAWLEASEALENTENP